MSSDSVLEYPPGVSGQVWDRVGDRPVHVGRVELRHRDLAVGSGAIGPDGAFGIEAAPVRPLLPGMYELVVDAPGYASVRCGVEVRADVPSCRVGRIDLGPASEG